MDFNIFVQMKQTFISSLSNLLETRQKIVLIPHKNPDGDALGSTLALAHFLTDKGHEATVVSPNDYPVFLEWLPGQKDIVKYTENALLAKEKIAQATVIFTLDFNDLSRIDQLEPLVKKATASLVMIDHHEDPKAYAELIYSDKNASSTCEMVFEVLQALDEQGLSPAIANCLYTGIMTDTGSFKYPATTAATHRAIAALIEAGAENTSIHQKIYDTSSFDRLKLLGITLSSMKKVEDLPVVYMMLHQATLNACNYRKGDTEGFVNYGLSLEGIQMAVILIENEGEGKIKMSFRSKGRFSVNEFARKYFNGGGHLNAAGGMSEQSMALTEATLISALQETQNQFDLEA